MRTLTNDVFLIKMSTIFKSLERKLFKRFSSNDYPLLLNTGWSLSVLLSFHQSDQLGEHLKISVFLRCFPESVELIRMSFHVSLHILTVLDIYFLRSLTRLFMCIYLFSEQSRLNKSNTFKGIGCCPFV